MEPSKHIQIGDPGAYLPLISAAALKALSELISIQGIKEGPVGSALDFWLEYCAQYQGDKSIYWDQYECLALSACASVVAAAGPEELALMWLESEQGGIWQQETLGDRLAGRAKLKEIPYIAEDVTSLIFAELHYLAANFDSPLIKWLNNGWEAFELALSEQVKKEGPGLAKPG